MKKIVSIISIIVCIACNTSHTLPKEEQEQIKKMVYDFEYDFMTYSKIDSQYITSRFKLYMDSISKQFKISDLDLIETLPLKKNDPFYEKYFKQYSEFSKIKYYSECDKVLIKVRTYFTKTNTFYLLIQEDNQWKIDCRVHSFYNVCSLK